MCVFNVSARNSFKGANTDAGMYRILQCSKCNSRNRLSLLKNPGGSSGLLLISKELSKNNTSLQTKDNDEMRSACIGVRSASKVGAPATVRSRHDRARGASGGGKAGLSHEQCLGAESAGLAAAADQHKSAVRMLSVRMVVSTGGRCFSRRGGHHRTPLRTRNKTMVENSAVFGFGPC